MKAHLESVLALSACIMAWTAAPAAAQTALRCVLALQDHAIGEAGTPPLAGLKEGTERGFIKCAAGHRQAHIWTLDIGSSPRAGVRVDPLFRTSIVGPLQLMAQLTLAGAARLSIFERETTASQTRAGAVSRRHRYQRFMTLCDAATAADPLNCSYGAARVKGRVTMADADRDGELDTALHEISVFDGGTRLHVIAFSTGLAAQPEDHAGVWVEALQATAILRRD